MKRYTIIVAGGTGQRFGSNVPKQFLELAGKPVLMHTIEKFAAIGGDIIVVLPEDFIDHWKELCNKFIFPFVHTIVAGGETRTESVRNGLIQTSDDSIIGVHDAVRPLVSRALIEKIFLAAAEKGNAVPAVQIQHSIRKVEQEKNVSVGREKYFIVQTPQCFAGSTLKAAYHKITTTSFTDDASVVEANGEKINLIEGESTNIKITDPPDLLYAESLIRAGITG